MEMLSRISLEYELTNVEWVTENKVFTSNCGLKRVIFWEDKQLLDWHVQWRDEFWQHSGILVNRMIRTKDGTPYMLIEKGFITVHDEVEEAFVFSEKVLGKLIGNLITFGNKPNEETSVTVMPKEWSVKSNSKDLQSIRLNDELAQLMLERSFFEAKNRMKKSENVAANVKGDVPTLLPILPDIQGRQVFNFLFYTFEDDYPIKSFAPIRKVLEHWLTKHTEQSMLALLDEVDKYCSLKEGYGRLLLAECLKPIELTHAIEQFKICTSKDNEAAVMEEYLKAWDTSKRLVLLISKWIEEKREKVAK